MDQLIAFIEEALGLGDINDGIAIALFIVIVLIGLVSIFALGVEITLAIKYVRFNRVQNSRGQNGEEIARTLLDKEGLNHIRVSVTGSFLFGNSYSHYFKKVRLSNDSDLLLAQASKAIIYGFNIRPDARITAKANEAGVEIRTHQIIYEVLEEIEALVKGMYKAEQVEQVTGQAEIRHIYKISKIGTIGGSYVTSGTIKAGSKIRLLRAGVVVYTGELAGLKRFKDDAKEVREGYECGISIKNYNDIKEGDIVEGYEMVDKE